MLGSIVIANYIIVTADSKTSIYRGKGQNMLFVMLSQEASYLRITKMSVTKMSYYQNVLLYYQNVRLPKRPVTEMSCYQNVRYQNVHYQSVIVIVSNI